MKQKIKLGRFNATTLVPAEQNFQQLWIGDHMRLILRNGKPETIELYGTQNVTIEIGDYVNLKVKKFNQTENDENETK